MAHETWTRELAAHLLRRAGFGATPAELDQYEAMGHERSVDVLVDYEQVSNAALDTLLGGLGLDFTRVRDVQIWWLARMLYTARPLEEKMVFFWHDHFATSVEKVSAEFMKRQLDMFRANALPSFRDMLVAVSRDPAMLDWLDNRVNRVGRPNENYGRELMELFSLGIGNYTEEDVKEVARCFTGWTIRNDDYMFVAGGHDQGAKSFLGVSIPPNGGEQDGLTVCATLAAHPVCARFMARKLFEFFVYPNPSEATIDEYAEIYTKSGFSIREVMRAIFLSDEFFSEKAIYGLVKSPTEYVVGALKALEANVNYRRVIGDIAAMGQVLLAPPDVNGWDGGLAWINTTTLLARANFANALLTERSTNGRGYAVDVDALLEGKEFTKANKLVKHLLSRLGPIALTGAERKPLKNYVLYDDGGVKGPLVLDEQTKDKKVRGLTHLVMTLPEYHLG
jgi:uncharacterized protein (DUF1800 family)